MKVIYYGCWKMPGHHFWLPGMQIIPILGRPDKIVPWGMRVEDLAPQEDGDRGVQGRASLSFREGWTALAFADRTVDVRARSISVYCFDEELSFQKAVQVAHGTFREVFLRYLASITPAKSVKGNDPFR